MRCTREMGGLGEGESGVCVHKLTNAYRESVNPWRLGRSAAPKPVRIDTALHAPTCALFSLPLLLLLSLPPSLPPLHLAMAAVASRSIWSTADPDDPLAKALQPPIDETPDERALRLRQFEDAARVSKEIDDEIAQAKKAYDRRKKAIKILLLGARPLIPSSPPSDLSPGQAESGKSTTLKSSSLHVRPDPSHSPPSRLPACLLPPALCQGTRRMENHHPPQPHQVRPILTLPHTPSISRPDASSVY